MDDLWESIANEENDQFPNEDIDFAYLKQTEEVVVRPVLASSTDNAILLNIEQDGKEFQIWMPKKTLYGDCSGVFGWAASTFYDNVKIAMEEFASDFEGM